MPINGIEERRYVIIPEADLTIQMIEDCLETDFNTLRWNNDHSKTILKYEGTKPASITQFIDYSHSEILVELEKPEWNEIIA